MGKVVGMDHDYPEYLDDAVYLRVFLLLCQPRLMEGANTNNPEHYWILLGFQSISEVKQQLNFTCIFAINSL